MREIEQATKLNYITMRNYVIDPETGNIQFLNSDNPIIAHVDHVRFFEAATKRIKPDKTINMGIDMRPVDPVELEDLSKVSEREKLALRNRLAHIIRLRAGIATNYHNDPDGQAAYQEGKVAVELARYHHYPDFLRKAVAVAEESYKRGVPTNKLLVEQ